ncbi:MAG TPA: hypothetical protein VK524_08805 [Polyangiaceae bacterium]|nr:hypothetical protein [Polyangiaceae bacterium]
MTHARPKRGPFDTAAMPRGEHGSRMNQDAGAGKPSRIDQGHDRSVLRLLRVN